MGEEADAVIVHQLFRRVSNCKTWKIRRRILLEEFAPLFQERGVCVKEEGSLVVFSKTLSGEIFKIAFRDSRNDWRIKCFIAEEEDWELPREYHGKVMDFLISMMAKKALVRS